MSDWLDEREFYEVCQLYRHSKEYGPSAAPTAVEAFELLKMFIRNSQAAEIARLKEDAERYRWLADRVLACDYGDNDAAGEQIGWRIRHDLLAADGKRQPAFMFGKSIDAAIEAAKGKS